MTTISDQLVTCKGTTQDVIDLLHKSMRQVHNATGAIEHYQNALNHLTFAVLELDKAMQELAKHEDP